MTEDQRQPGKHGEHDIMQTKPPRCTSSGLRLNSPIRWAMGISPARRWAFRFFHFNGSKRVSKDYFKSLNPHRLPERGDILYSAVGATLGIPAVVDSDEPFCFQRHIAILKPNRSKVESRFAWHMLGSRSAFEKAWASTTGSAQPTVPLRAICELSIPVPPMAEQRRIVAELDALQAEVDELKRLQAESAAELDALLPAVLDQAFKGEL